MQPQQFCNNILLSYNTLIYNIYKINTKMTWKNIMSYKEYFFRTNYKANKNKNILLYNSNKINIIDNLE